MQLPNFDSTDSDGRKYREVVLPGGTFRMYEDRPYVWTEVREPGQPHWFRKVEELFERGELQ
jgi:hypothetical protein